MSEQIIPIPIRKRTPDEINIELILMIQDLKEKINELRFMVEGQAEAIEELKKENNNHLNDITKLYKLFLRKESQ